MAEIILITGGARSGKSRHAQSLAESGAGGRLFLATSPITDQEMRQRIERHRHDREDRGWRTVEETMRPMDILAGHPDCEVVLLDCLTLWISNLLFESEDPELLSEETVNGLAGELLEAARRRQGVVIIVTNEVGLGIVPENPLARHYRDLLGRCNQTVAAGADRVDLVTCGIPQTIKGI